MWIPLAILAAFATAIGLILHRSEWLTNLLQYTPSLATAAMRLTPSPGVFHWNVAVASSLFALLGVAIAAYFYLGDRQEVQALARRFSSPWLGSPYLLSRGKLFVDEIYGWLIVRPIQVLATICAWLDRWLIDQLVDTIGAIPRFIGGWLRTLQSGFTPFYGLAMILIMMLLLGARALWGAF